MLVFRRAFIARNVITICVVLPRWQKGDRRREWRSHTGVGPIEKMSQLYGGNQDEEWQPLETIGAAPNRDESNHSGRQYQRIKPPDG